MRWLRRHGKFSSCSSIFNAEIPQKVFTYFFFRFLSILCGDLAIKLIEEPFVTEADDLEEWAV